LKRLDEHRESRARSSYLFGARTDVAIMAIWLPDLDAVKGTSDNHTRTQKHSCVLTKFFIEVYATLGINGDLNGICGKGALFIAVHFPTTHLLEHFLCDLLEGFSSEDVYALIAAKG
jgi:hypothetical protein